jgi:hypothetical protein
VRKKFSEVLNELGLLCTEGPSLKKNVEEGEQGVDGPSFCYIFGFNEAGKYRSLTDLVVLVLDKGPQYLLFLKPDFFRRAWQMVPDIKYLYRWRRTQL